MRSTRLTEERDRGRDLRTAIERTGYYPDVVADAVAGAIAGEQVVSFYVHHEPTFDRDEVRRHLIVVVLTPTRLVLAHTDEHAGDDLLPEPYTSTSTEAIRAVSSVKSVVVTRMIANPTKGPQPAGRGGAHDRLGRRQPPRPGARVLRRPAVRGRPRLHRRARLRRLLAAGLGGGRRPGRRRRPARRSPSRSRRAPTPADRCPTSSSPPTAGGLWVTSSRRSPLRSGCRRRSRPSGLGLPEAPSYVVFLVDGLGSRLLERYAARGAVPVLAAGRRAGHRRSPVDHGHQPDLARHRADPGHARPGRASRRGSRAPTGCSTRCSGTRTVDPLEWQPHPTAFSRLGALACG